MNTAPPSNAQFLDDATAMACVHCGLCLGDCPTYLVTGNENDSPRGRIYLMRAMQAGRLPIQGTAARHIDLCLGCRACEVACPSGVRYGELLEATRSHIEPRQRRPLWQRFLRKWFIERVLPFPARTRIALGPAILAKQLKIDRILPGSLRELLAFVPLRLSPTRLPEHLPAQSGPAHTRAALLTGCVAQVLFSQTNLSSARLLSATGCDVIIPPDQKCCGALFAHNGNLQRARECARHLIAAFEKSKADILIVNAAGCGSTLKEYGHLLKDDPEWFQRAADFSSRVRDLTEWLAQASLPDLVPVHEPVAYHDACHLAHAQRITAPPRTLVRRVAGPHFFELEEAAVCCGSAGSYNLTEPAMARRLQQRKVEHILNSGVKRIITTNPGCILQIESGLKSAAPNARSVQVQHLADFLADHLPESQKPEARSQRPETRDQRPETRDQRPEIGDQRSEV